MKAKELPSVHESLLKYLDDNYSDSIENIRSLEDLRFAQGQQDVIKRIKEVYNAQEKGK